VTVCNACGRPGPVQALDHARPVCGPCWCAVVDALRDRTHP
jgi:hypothetical protein